MESEGERCRTRVSKKHYSHDTEADAVGLKLMAQACFDPAEASAQVSAFSRTGRVPILTLLQVLGTDGGV